MQVEWKSNHHPLLANMLLLKNHKFVLKNPLTNNLNTNFWRLEEQSQLLLSTIKHHNILILSAILDYPS